MYTHVHSSNIHNSQKVETVQMSINDEWIDKLWYIHTSECHSTLKRKEILIHATTWMNPEDIKLNEISQSQKDKYYVIPLKWDSYSSQIHRGRK